MKFLVPFTLLVAVGHRIDWPTERLEAPAALEWVEARNAATTAELTRHPAYQPIYERTLAILNSRIKDHFDIHHLATHYEFDGATLGRAIKGVFARRSTEFPAAEPVALTDEFWDVTEREIHVRAFARRARIDADLASARALLPLLRDFLMPPLLALREGARFNGAWSPGGPWRDRSPSAGETGRLKRES